MAKLKRTEQVPKEVIYAYKCDHCTKVEEGERTQSGEGDQPDGWHSFRSHHDDWGNDSIETFNNHDVCSWACYLAIVRKVFEDYGTPPEIGGAPRVPRRPYPTLEIDGRDWYFVRDMLAHQPEHSEA
jgi:hypothetical protein